MKVRRSIAALGAFFVLVISVAACGSSEPGNSVADVAGNPITTQAFNHWMYVAAKSQASQSPGQPVIVPNDPPNFNNCIAQARKAIPSLAKTPTKTLRADCKQLYTSLSSQVLDFLITAYWYQALAAKQGIKVSDAEVQKAFDTAKKQNPQVLTQAGLQNFLKSTGQTLDDVLYRFRINEVIKKLMAKQNTKVTPAQISSYYNSHQSQFGTPESRNMRVVLAKNQADAEAAKKALQSGQSWADVAKKYSTDPTSKNNGGLLTGITKQQADPALATAAFSAPVNKLLGPVKGQFGYYVFDVNKVTPATHQSLAQATALIKQQLNQQQQQTAQTAITNQAKKEWLSQTTCRPQYAMADCKGYKAPKTATTTGTGTATTG
jgi:foldase protein PrsA